MKKLIVLSLFALSMAFIAPTAKAQSDLKSRYSVALDTVTNTGVKNLTTLRVSGAQSEVTITTVNTLLTGTLSGVARLYGSLDGVNYQRVRANLLRGNGGVAAVDSLVIDANRRFYGWTVEKNPYQYYQIQTTGIGTVTFTVKGKYAAH